CAQAPWASIWIVEFVKKVITGHIRTPRANARPGQRQARHRLRRQTSVPTTASATRQSPRIKKPVAKSQWTCSAGGFMLILEVVEQSGHDDEVEEEADRDDEQRRLDEEPPEPLAMRMQQRDPVRLHDGPDEPRQRRCRAE